MSIPAPLAYPPTALKNVAAGLIVGNPVGSSGTRAKALTSAELKAIVEASGISYLPLAGGTLTGSLTIGSNSLRGGSNLLLENADTLSGQIRFRDGAGNIRGRLDMAAGQFQSVTGYQYGSGFAGMNTPAASTPPELKS